MAKMYFLEGGIHWGKGGRKGEKQQQSIQQKQSAELSCYAFIPGVAGGRFADREQEGCLLYRTTPAAASRELTLQQLTLCVAFC